MITNTVTTTSPVSASPVYPAMIENKMIAHSPGIDPPLLFGFIRIALLSSVQEKIRSLIVSYIRSRIYRLTMARLACAAHFLAGLALC